MKKRRIVFFLLAFSLFSSNILAATGIAVIPLVTTKKLQNVVTVSARGADFTNPVAAVNSISNADASNPYLVVIGPGRYSLTQTLAMEEHVSIIGAGEQVTTLTGTISTGSKDATSAIVSGSNNATLSDLTVENTGGSVYSIALYNNGSSPTMNDVILKASGGSTSNYGVYNESASSPTMTNVTTSASGGSTSDYGVYNDSSSPTMTNVAASATGGSTRNFGVYNDSSSPTMTNVAASASGGSLSDYGVVNTSSSSPTMNNVIASATGGAAGYGVVNDSSSPTLRHCTMQGPTDGIYVAGGITRVIQSSILGGVLVTSGTLSCVNSDNGVDTALDASCN